MKEQIKKIKKKRKKEKTYLRPRRTKFGGVVNSSHFFFFFLFFLFMPLKFQMGFPCFANIYISKGYLLVNLLFKEKRNLGNFGKSTVDAPLMCYLRFKN